MIATVTLHKTGQRMSAELKEMEQKRVAEFRPSKSFKWDYGFDWFREGRDGDGNINFKKIYDRPLLFDNFEKEYEAQKIDYSGWSERIKDKDNRYCSWLSLYPPDAGYGASVAKLRLLIYDGDKSKRPLKLEYDKDCFRITPDVLPPDKKSTKGHIYKEEITIECLKEFSDKKAIRVLTDDDRDEEVGCLYVMPNDASHRYKLKVRLVNVSLFAEDKAALGRVIRVDKITPLLNKGCLSHYFVRPELQAEIRDLDLTSEREKWKQHKTLVPQQDGSGEEMVIAKSNIDSLFNDIIAAYRKRYNEIDSKLEMGDMDRLVLFFINYKCAEYTENLDYLYGYTQTPGLYGIIMVNGINQYTLSHEISHSLGLDHTFPDMDNMIGHLFTKHSTDNIMDYAQNEKDGEKFKSTYKWQWDKVKDTAQKREIIKENNTYNEN